MKYIILILTTITISCNKNENIQSCGETVTDIDGNTYKTISIGSQCWMVENLKTTRFNDGTNILEIKDINDWHDNFHDNDKSAAWCVYQNNSALSNNYGKLYNWYAVKSGKLAPKGWHIPTDEEWTILINHLGGEDSAGAKMKSTTGWIASPGITNTNSSGFSAVAAGFRNNLGDFNWAGTNTFFWSSTPDENNSAWIRQFARNNQLAFRNQADNYNGLSVRCIKD